MAIDKSTRRLRIKRSIRKKVKGTAKRPRLSVFKSNTGIYAQLIDDLTGQTISFSSSKELGEIKNIGVGQSKEVGINLAKKAMSNGIKRVVFDRNGYIYHGKLKAFAEGAREGGLNF